MEEAPEAPRSIGGEAAAEMSRPIVFCYNRTSWDRRGIPVPGGMADAIVRPIIEHLGDHPYEIARNPREDAVNVYLAHRSQYVPAVGETAVFISHGIADKNWRSGSRVAKEFAFIFVSGPAWTQKMRHDGLMAHRILEAGYPTLDPIFQGKLPKPKPDRRIRVVWAPTHGGGGEKSALSGKPPKTFGAKVTTHWRRQEILDLLDPDVFDVVEAMHPRHRPDHRATLDEYVGADVVVADGGSTIYEAMALGLPVVFPSWLTMMANLNRHNRSFENKIYSDRIGRHALRPVDFVPLLKQATRDGITSSEVEFIETILPEKYRGKGGELHAASLVDIANNQDPRNMARDKHIKFRHKTTKRVASVVIGTPRHQIMERNPRWEEVKKEG